jgi:nucleoid DNA-binding protein
LLKDEHLNTTELVDAIAEANDLSKAKAKEVVNSIFAEIVEAAKRGDDVVIKWFWPFRGQRAVGPRRSQPRDRCAAQDSRFEVARL